MMWMDKLIQYFSRKFVLTGAALIGSFVLAMYEKDLIAWATALGVTTVPYITGNIFEQKFAQKQEPVSKSQINIEDATVNVEAEKNG